MKFLRHWRLLACALLLGGGPLAQAASREERAFAAAAAEFHAALWSRAEADFGRFVQRYAKSTNTAPALLLQAQARFHQGKFPETIALLTDPANLATAHAAGAGDQFAQWTAEAQFAAGNFTAAAETWQALTRSFPASPLGLRAIVNAAAARGQAGDWPQAGALLREADGIFQRAAQQEQDTGTELVARGWLLLAQAELAQKNLAGAAGELAHLPSALPSELAWQRAQLLYQVKFGTGDFPAALAAATNLVQLAPLQKNPAGPALAWSALGAALEKLNRLPEAVTAYAANLTANAPLELQQSAILKLATLSAAQKDFTNAASRLEQFLAQFTNSPAAPTVGLALGELHLNQFVADRAAPVQLSLAREKFEQLLAADTNSVLAGRAFLGRGWCDWLVTNPPAALADFSRAASLLPPSEEQAVAKFKTGDAQFGLTNYAGAADSYQAVLADYAMFPLVAQALGDRALYQLLRVNLELTNAVAAATAAEALLKKFPASDFDDNGLLLLGEGLTDFRQPENARAVFRKFAARFPDSPLKPQALLAVARTFEREPTWSTAVTNYENWLALYPTNELRPQAEFALAQAKYQAGDATNAFRLFAQFFAQHSTDARAPFAQWWLADEFFRAGNYVGAETNYENVFQNPAWQSSRLYYPAQLMAGRAAMAHQSFSDAVSYFTKALDSNCPPEIAVAVRFACVAALKQAAPADTNSPLANLQTATNLLGQICRLHPADETGARALGELAECSALMNDFESATNFYAQVVADPAAGFRLQSMALVGWGMTLEKAAALLPPAEQPGLLRLALGNYCAVLFATSDQADPSWMKKAGWQALPLMQRLHEGNVDKVIDNLERWLPQLRSALEKKRETLNAGRN